MQKTVLVPLDGSPAGERVLPWAIEMARARRQTVTLAQVVRWPPFPLYPDGIWVNSAEVYDEILEVAHEAEADLIVMASHERSAPARWIHGSVASAVARHADIPVLLAGPRALVEHAFGSLRVGDVIVPTRTRVRQYDSLESAVRLLNRHGMGGVPVVDAAGRLVGMLSAAALENWEARLVALLARASTPNAASYAEYLTRETEDKVMERPAATVEAGTPLVEAFDLLCQERSGLLVVTHKGRAVGVLTSADVVRAMSGPLMPAGRHNAGAPMSA